VLAFAGRNDHRGDFGPRDDFPVVGRADLRADLLRELPGITLGKIGDREKIDCRMLGREPRAQRADTA